MTNSSEAFSEEQIKVLHQIFAQGFTEVVLPHIDEMKKDIEQLKNNDREAKEDMDEVKERLGSIENKLDSTIERTDDHELKIQQLQQKLA
jgi:chromosome segregation ATPase